MSRNPLTIEAIDIERFLFWGRLAWAVPLIGGVLIDLFLVILSPAPALAGGQLDVAAVVMTALGTFAGVGLARVLSAERRHADMRGVIVATVAMIVLQILTQFIL